MIYYNYGPSKDWPQFDAVDPSKASGRCVIAPFFYRYDHPFVAPGAPYRLPPYFDNTLFAADWFRWVDSRERPIFYLKGDFPFLDIPVRFLVSVHRMGEKTRVKPLRT